MTAVLWGVVPLAILIGLYRWTFRIESHWVSKDGRRFVCQVQPIRSPGAAEGRPGAAPGIDRPDGLVTLSLRRVGSTGADEGRPRESRVVVRPDGLLSLSRRREADSDWRVVGRSPTPPNRRVIYVLRPADGSTDEVTMRLPENSRAVPVLDEILARRLSALGTRAKRSTRVPATVGFVWLRQPKHRTVPIGRLAHRLGSLCDVGDHLIDLRAELIEVDQERIVPVG